MDMFRRWRNARDKDEFTTLESYLSTTLIPVLPNQNFVRELQSRLLAESLTPEGVSGMSLVHYLLLITAALVGVSLVIVTGIRIFVGILAILGIVQSTNRQRRDPAHVQTLKPV